MTASFLPKPVTGVNGNGMHTNISVSKNGKNIFYGTGAEGLSNAGWQFIERILTSANDICLVLNASVNAYRRLDPHFEAPNQIKASPVDRGSMVRIPIGNENSARVEVRSVGPDANPYLVIYTLLKTGLEGPLTEGVRTQERYLPDNIYTALDNFRASQFVATLLGEEVAVKYGDLKQAAADRCPRLLGSLIKTGEIQFHHEVYNQALWTQF
jgi:glutamine synthetase